MKRIVSIAIFMGLLVSANGVLAQVDREKCEAALKRYQSCQKANHEKICRDILYREGKEVCVAESAPPMDQTGDYAGVDLAPDDFVCRVQLPFCRLLPFISGCEYKRLCRCDKTYSSKCSNLFL